MNAAGHKEHEAPLRQQPTAFRLFSAVHDVVIRVYDEAVKTHEHKGDFKEP
jgi:hypothetical protein